MPSGRIVDHLPDQFRFMSLFGWSHRKGPDVLCRSFLREFTTKDDACLVIYARHWGRIAEEIQEFYKEMDGPNLPTIYWCGDTIPIRDLPGCYAAADCFVFCSRGEGFGLPVCEAGACGIPVISTYNSAMMEYLEEDTAFLVHTDELEKADERLTRITTFYQGQLFPKLGEKAIVDVRRHMRTVYSSPAEVKEKADRFRRKILENYTWDICAEKVASQLRTN
jgi:glycosyltransferase involved in cell wall biosynthesis